MLRRLAAALAVLLFFIPLASAQFNPYGGDTGFAVSDVLVPPVAPAAPLSPWWERSVLDGDRSGVHDTLEALGPLAFPVVVVVDYAKEPGDGDVGQLSRLGLDIGVVLPALGAVSARAYSMTQIRAAAVLPETVMVEMGGRPYLALDVANAAMKGRPSEQYSPDTAWQLGFTGEGIVIAIMDTGVDNEHPGLIGKWLGGIDVSKPETRLTPRDGTFDADDTQGHGTSVAGMALGTGAPDGTYAGLAPGTKLVDLRIGTIIGAAPGEGPQNFYDGTLQGIDWAVRFKDFAWPGGTPGIDILSLSWGNDVGGSSDGSDVYSRGIDRLVQAGIVAVIAAGNSGPSNDGFDGLGSSSYSITIGALDDFNTVDRSDDDIASYSSRGPRADNGDSYSWDELKPEVSAPGTDIMSAEFDRVGDGSGNSYGPRGSGTSYATPMVAGVVSMMLEANPDLKTQWRLVKEILTATAERRGNASLPEVDPFWNKDFGYGMVDAYKAVALAKSLRGVVDTVDPELQAFIMNTSAGNRTVAAELTVNGVSYAKRGTIDRVEMQVDDGPWVTVEGVGAPEQKPFSFRVDTRGFSDGNHTVRVRAVGAGFFSLADEVTFKVQGAPPRATTGLTDGMVFLLVAVAVCVPAIYAVRKRVVRGRSESTLEPLENF